MECMNPPKNISVSNPSNESINGTLAENAIPEPFMSVQEAITLIIMITGYTISCIYLTRHYYRLRRPTNPNGTSPYLPEKQLTIFCIGILFYCLSSNLYDAIYEENSIMNLYCSYLLNTSVVLLVIALDTFLSSHSSLTKFSIVKVIAKKRYTLYSLCSSGIASIMLLDESEDFVDAILAILALLRVVTLIIFFFSMVQCTDGLRKLSSKLNTEFTWTSMRVYWILYLIFDISAVCLYAYVFVEEYEKEMDIYFLVSMLPAYDVIFFFGNFVCASCTREKSGAGAVVKKEDTTILNYVRVLVQIFEYYKNVRVPEKSPTCVQPPADVLLKELSPTSETSTATCISQV